MKEKEYVVYKHTNTVNGKVYIGLTCQDPQVRWGKDGKGYEGSTYFYNAIQKYGWDHFDHEIIQANLTQTEAQHLEEVLIAEYKSNQKEYGYNLTSGGENNIPNDAVRKKKSEIMKGPSNNMLGKKHTPEELEW